MSAAQDVDSKVLVGRRALGGELFLQGGSESFGGGGQAHLGAEIGQQLSGAGRADQLVRPVGVGTGPGHGDVAGAQLLGQFAVLAVAAQLDRDYIRQKTLEGQRAAAAKGNHGGRPKVFDQDMIIFARALHDKGVPVPQIAAKLVIKTGKNAGKHPSVASVYRALADDAATAVQTAA